MKLGLQQIGQAVVTGLIHGRRKRELIVNPGPDGQESLQTGGRGGRAAMARERAVQKWTAVIVDLPRQHHVDDLARMPEQSCTGGVMRAKLAEALSSGDQSPVVEWSVVSPGVLATAGQVFKTSACGSLPAVSVKGLMARQPQQSQSCFAGIIKRLPTASHLVVTGNQLADEGAITQLHGHDAKG